MGLPDTLKLEAATARASGFSATTINDGATQNGSAIDNASNLDALLSAEFVWSYGSAPTANKTIRAHLEYALDGTNFENADATNQIASFSPPADTDTHRIVKLRNVPLLPFKFRLTIVNVDTGQQIIVTVNAYTHNDAIAD